MSLHRLPDGVGGAARRRLLAYAALTCAASGCWYSVEEYCAGCARVAAPQIAVPEPAASTHTEVVLVHGAFGFGSEWTPIVETLRQTPGFDFFAWTWRGAGPFGNPPADAQILAAELQALIDKLPPSVHEVVVLAHSAGGLITNLAARQLHTGPGRRVTVALLDPVFWPMLTLWPELARPEAYAKVPAGVAMTVYLAAEAPAAKLGPADPRTATDLPQVYVGNLGHNLMVAAVALPILAARQHAIGIP